jgi:hypothetical protein
MLHWRGIRLDNTATVRPPTCVDLKGADGIVERLSGGLAAPNLVMVMTSMAEEKNSASDLRPTAGSAPGPEPTPSSDAGTAALGGAAQGAAANASGSAREQNKTALTPGQRLAQKRDKKALQKRDFKADLKREEEEQAEQEQAEAERIMGVRRAPLAPDSVQEVATEFTGYVQGHRARIVGGVALVVGLGVALVLGRDYLGAGSAHQAQLLGTALEIANAPVDPSNTDGKNADGKPVFKSAADRATKAGDAFASAARDEPGTRAAAWADLARASLLTVGGKADRAATLYQATYNAHKGDVVLGAQALEGLAIALETTGKLDDALKRFQELKGYDGGAQKDLAEYHIARVKLAKGDREGAKTLLKEVYDRLGAPAEGAPRSRFLKGEVEARLAELDSSLVPAGGSEAQQFSPEEIQRLIQQLQQKGGHPPTGAGNE